MKIPEKRTADFSQDRQYRYTLRIRWNEGDLIQFIGLNPSTADENQDDATIRVCKAFARRWGAGGIVMTNLFAFMSTYPKVMFQHPNPIGEPGRFITVCNSEFDNRNDMALWSTASECKRRIACWGTGGDHLYRALKVMRWLPAVECLRKTKGGHPHHPLRLSLALTPQPYLRS
jgi:hypothetical protein